MYNPTKVPVEKAAFILGTDAQTLRLCMQRGYYKDIGEATKTGKECYRYDISKYKLYQRQGLDIRYSVDEVIELIKQGTPPFIEQVPKELLELCRSWQKEKDTLPSTKLTSV